MVYVGVVLGADSKNSKTGFLNWIARWLPGDGVLTVLAYGSHVTVQTFRPLTGLREVLIVMTASLLFSQPGKSTFSNPEEEVFLKIRVSFWV